MIQSFDDQETADIFNGINSKDARKRLNPSLYPIAHRKLDLLNSAVNLDDLRAPPGNKLEALKGDLKGKYSIRINDQYRIVFAWDSQGPKQVRIMDYP